MIKIIPSVASADVLDLRKAINSCAELGRLHLDIEDGNFIDNITFGMKTVSAIATEFLGDIDVHLLTTRPEEYLPALAELGIKAVCGHVEAMQYPMRFLRRAHKFGMKAGLAFNMKVLPEELLPYTDELDYIIVMTSEPDDGKQDFFSCALQRVERFRALLPTDAQLWCDGGISPEKLAALSKAGMDTAIMGRSVFCTGNPTAAVKDYERYVD